MANAFNKGDMVQLISGGPPMTVDRGPGETDPRNARELREYLCAWFKGASKETGYFGEHVLQNYRPPSK